MTPLRTTTRPPTTARAVPLGGYKTESYQLALARHGFASEEPGSLSFAEYEQSVDHALNGGTLGPDGRIGSGPTRPRPDAMEAIQG